MHKQHYSSKTCLTAEIFCFQFAAFSCYCAVQSIFGLSDDQVQDLMFLREVYILKEGELNMQQAALTARMQDRSSDPVIEVARVASIGTELRVNAAQCHKLIQKLCHAMYFGVSDAISALLELCFV